MSKTLKEGANAPDFTVTDGDGKTVRLKDFRGKKVVLYFIPKTTRRAAPKKHVLSETPIQRFEDAASKCSVFPWTAKNLIRSLPKNMTCHFICWLIRTAPFRTSTELMARKSLWDGLIWAIIE